MGVEDAEVQLSPEEQRKKDLLLNGPALNGPENKQDDIDAMFGGEDAGAAMSQDDLDALFD